MRSPYARALCFLVATLLIAAACTRDPRSAVDRRSATPINPALRISMPCSLVWCGSYFDRGSQGGVLVGSAGDTLLWAWAGGINLPTPPASVRHDRARFDSWADSMVRANPMPVYIGAKHYREPGAVPLAIGSPDESLFIRILWSAIGADSVPTPTRIAKQRYGPRAAGVARALQKQRAGLPAVRILFEMPAPG